MSTSTRMIVQAILAGLVASLALVGIRSIANAQWTEPSEPPPTESSEPEQPAMMAPAGDACAYITEAEAVEVLGAAVSEMRDGSQCTYVAQDLSGRSVSVAVTPDLSQGEGGLAPIMDQLANAIGTTATPVDIGAEAFVVFSSTLAEVAATAESGQTIVVVMTMPAASEADTTAMLRDLGAAALSRL